MGHQRELVAWVDTAFNGGLSLPHDVISGLGLAKESMIEAILADGRTVVMPVFRCYIEWFGNRYKTEVIASDAKSALLGTILLADRDLHINSKAKVVELT